MSDERRLRGDVWALLLLGVTVVLAVSLVSYDRADPPGTLVWPPHPTPQNACGSLGAHLAHALLSAFGIGAYYVVGSLAVVNVLLLVRRPIGQPAVRAVGWLASLAGLTTLSALAIRGWSPGPVIGAGGFVGAAGRGLLELHFAVVGAYLLAVSVTIAGLLLCTDYVLLRLTALVIGSPTRAVARGISHRLAARRAAPNHAAPTSKKKPAKAAAPVPPLAPTAEAAEDDAELDAEVRVVHRAPDPEGANPEEAAADDEDDKPSMARRLASALRIKSRQERQRVIAELDAADEAAEEAIDYELPAMNLLLEPEPFALEEQEKEVRKRAKILEQTFASFGFTVRVVEIETGPVIAQYEVELEAGLRLSKITGLSEDLAIALRVPTVRIVAPIPGKNTVGIEVPNTNRQLVRLREVIEEATGRAKKMRIPIYLGKDVAGNSMCVDLSTLPHLLIAGRTGTGKSVCLNTIIMSLLMARRPDEVRLLMIDPKMVELTPYMKLPHLMHPVITDMKKAEAVLAWAVEKMEERYALLARAGVRHISLYNQLGEEELMERLQPEDDEERKMIPTQLPFIVIVADEMADLMMTAPKEVESHIIRLAQKSRAVGIHLVLATQKPTVDVITGLIKSNLPARIAFQVASKTDSRVVLDESGADKLLGNGDMLFLWPGTSTLLRGQGAYVSDDEINRVVEFLGQHEPQFVKELVQLPVASSNGEPGAGRRNDDLYDAAVDLVLREGRGSVSLLQRSLGIGYGRAARLIDYMAEDGVVGQYNGAQARDVLITAEQWAERQQEQAAEAPPSPPPRKRSGHKIQLAPPRPVEQDFDDEPAESTAELPPWEGDVTDEDDAEAFEDDELDADAGDDQEEEDEPPAATSDESSDDDFSEDDFAEDEGESDEERGPPRRRVSRVRKAYRSRGA